ncbi:unnamed protein product [Vitrella brassicaformis CCMP3155]|uniref:Uncharacterized protein n=2 Tax=Vitrella brassicaformis TaxID=1169539 RepID=A0A0G4FKV1_VITBC|nr:unnamed protein product [Vitrella brassicaformis CCMP3155]|mmetsp:Transcript_37559/g.94221  ORF Transcript_37559/g.94221 Transcript_37559/m.94221 type:complete len:250 (+) Transcript_37559:14-763(+)|eukprot:CEM14000.1 unnamed protein product [Vitrella brassicaformis CCMP3155]
MRFRMVKSLSTFALGGAMVLAECTGAAPTTLRRHSSAAVPAFVPSLPFPSTHTRHSVRTVLGAEPPDRSHRARPSLSPLFSLVLPVLLFVAPIPLSFPTTNAPVDGITAAFLRQVQPVSAYADVYSGDTLPAGALQRDRFIKAKLRWEEMGSALRARTDDITADEWKGLRNFLRAMYKESDDMRFISKGLDPEKDKQSKQLIKNFEKTIESMDKPATAGDKEVFLASQQKITQTMQDFLDVLSDVPDEL